MLQQCDASCPTHPISHWLAACPSLRPAHGRKPLSIRCDFDIILAHASWQVKAFNAVLTKYRAVCRLTDQAGSATLQASCVLELEYSSTACQT